MRELKVIKSCAAVTDGVFDTDLADDNLAEWDVWLKRFDPDSNLAKVCRRWILLRVC